MSKTKVSKALLEVWKWKDECCREVAHLPRRKAISALLRNAERTARELNLGLKPATLPRRFMVAEEPPEYGISLEKKKNKRNSRRRRRLRLTGRLPALSLSKGCP